MFYSSKSRNDRIYPYTTQRTQNEAKNGNFEQNIGKPLISRKSLYCSNCGNQFDHEDVFCINCGHKLEK